MITKRVAIGLGLAAGAVATVYYMTHGSTSTAASPTPAPGPAPAPQPSGGGTAPPPPATAPTGGGTLVEGQTDQSFALNGLTSALIGLPSGAVWGPYPADAVAASSYLPGTAGAADAVSVGSGSYTAYWTAGDGTAETTAVTVS